MKDPQEENGGTQSSTRSRLIDAFRASKAKIKAWEAGFGSEGKKPPSLSLAPKAIQICYKNCKKIQYHLDTLEKEAKTAKEAKEDSRLKEGGEEKQCNDKQVSEAEAVESPSLPLRKSSTWGSHLNIQTQVDEKEALKLTDIPSTLLLSNDFGPPKVRTSLKRKKSGLPSRLLGNLLCDEPKPTQETASERSHSFEEENENEVEDIAFNPSSSSLFKESKPSNSQRTYIQLTTRMDGITPKEANAEDEMPSKRPRLEVEGVEEEATEENSASGDIPNALASSSSKQEQLLAKKKNWNDNYRRINLKKKKFTRFNKGIARKREEIANKAKMRAKGRGHHAGSYKKAGVGSSGAYNNNNGSSVIPEPLLVLPEVKATSTIFEKSDEDLDALLHEALEAFGHSEFRKGQKEAILRVLRGKSTLVVLSTGSGKSLIYQIPAYLLGREDNRLTIVVSPLVSLMEDQLRNMPSVIRADLLHGDMPSGQMDKVKTDLRDNKLFILFMTPETLFSQLKNLKEFIPRLGFVCIDEAHCMSQWSHNFRPAYFQLGGAIRDSLKTATVLGLTATATEKTIATVAERLQITPNDGGIIKGSALRNNLLLSISKDFRRDEALMDLLNSDKFSRLDSIIIYCTRREECERVAATIRTRRRSERTSKKQIEVASSFHAGISLAKRRRIYNDFISGKLKIIVATIAFGMGINKSDIRCVIHYNMPSTLESYVQEIGRAGRDDKESYCHLFMDSKGRDLNELKRHVYSNSLDRVIVRKFVSRLFNNGDLGSQEEGYRDVVLHAYDLVELLDMPEENITTLMCYLENDPGEWIQVKRQISEVVKVQMYGSVEKIRCKLSDTAVLDYILNNKTSDKSYRVTSMAKELKLTCEQVWDSLSRLKYAGASLDFGQPGFYLRVKNGVSENDLDSIQNLLCDKINEREKNEIYKLQRTFRTFLSVSQESVNSCIESYDAQSCQKLNDYISAYFSETHEETSPAILPSDPFAPVDEKPIRQQIRQFLSIYSDQNWTGRAVARVFHGIPSPNFPAQTWYRARGYWKAYMEMDFNVILRLATKEIIGLRTGLS